MTSVLLITSDPAFTRLVSWILSERQYDIAVCESVEDALQLIERDPPEIVLLNETGPDEEGAAATEKDAARLYDASPGIRVIEIDEPHAADRAPDFRGITQLRKPFTADDLTNHIEHVAEQA